MQDKETRLSSGRYRHNDIEIRRNANLRHRSSEHLTFQDFLGHFVFPDDGHEIKRHAFFRGIDWEHLHLMRPPEVPKVKDNLDTKYFDQEPTVSDMGESSGSMSEEELAAQEAFERKVLEAYHESARVQLGTQHGGGFDGQQNGDPMLFGGEDKGATEQAFIAAAYDVLKEEGEVKLKSKGKKRPRDRILRDKAVGKEALELRKRGAFLGYTYRRPQNILTEIEPNKEKSEHKFPRPSFHGLASLSPFRGPMSQG